MTRWNPSTLKIMAPSRCDRTFETRDASLSMLLRSLGVLSS